jgi:hypothetical protein
MRHPPTHEKFHEKKTGRHRRDTRSAREKLQQRISNFKSIRISHIALVGGVLTCLALGAMASTPSGVASASDVTGAQATAAREAADRSSRSSQRTSRSGAQPSATPGISPDPAAEAARLKAEQEKAAALATPAVTATTPPAPPAPPPTPAQPVPVAGLTQAQMNNASAIVKAGKSMGLPKRAFVLAVACALQESNLLNLASTALPESFSYPNEGTGSDHDSVGLFQQRPSAGWGTVQELMTPDFAAKAFYQVLIQIPGWDTMALTYAIQAVQLSAYPDAYAPHESQAQAVVDALT